MAWIKIPAENHPLFHAALPKDPRVSTLNMFGGVAATVNGHMFGGLFARGAIAKLAPADQADALALDGAEMFDPMGNGRVMRDTVFLPESVLDEPAELRMWMRKALDYTATLPPKKKKGVASGKAKPSTSATARGVAKAKARGAAKAKPAKPKAAKPTKRR